MTLSLIALLLLCKVSSVQPCNDLDLKAPHGSLALSSPSDFTSQSSLVTAQVPSLQPSPQCFHPQTTVHSLSLPVATSPPSFSPLPPAAPNFAFLIFPLLPNLTEIQLCKALCFSCSSIRVIHSPKIPASFPSPAPLPDCHESIPK